MTQLIVAALVWIALHLGIAGTTLRDAVVGRVGDQPFRGIFSVLSIAVLVVLVWAWSAATHHAAVGRARLATLGSGLRDAAGIVLFVASVNGRNPTMIGPSGNVAQPPRGMIRVTRHPMLWSFAIWAGVHILGNGDTAAIVFFGAFLITALAGMPSIDAKLARRDPNAWQALSAATSVVPFTAIAQGRNRFVPNEIGWLNPLIGAARLDRHPDRPPVAVRRGARSDVKLPFQPLISYPFLSLKPSPNQPSARTSTSPTAAPPPPARPADARTPPPRSPAPVTPERR